MIHLSDMLLCFPHQMQKAHLITFISEGELIFSDLSIKVLRNALLKIMRDFSFVGDCFFKSHLFSAIIFAYISNYTSFPFRWQRVEKSGDLHGCTCPMSPEELEGEHSSYHLGYQLINKLTL